MTGDNDNDPYPVSCPFCSIAKEYPSLSPSPSALSDAERLKAYVPETVDHTKLEPNSHLVLQSPEVMAFLDIMPMTRGHLLVTSRSHHVKIEDLPGKEAQDIGTASHCDGSTSMR
jgi:diadenosine tetraphosphate (Ap4A) HIT family hydrolase